MNPNMTSFFFFYFTELMCVKPFIPHTVVTPPDNWLVHQQEIGAAVKAILISFG